MLAILFALIVANPAPRCEGLTCLDRCEGGDGDACVVWASYIRKANDDGLRNLIAAPSWAKACQRNVIEGCVGLATILLSGEGVPKDFPAGTALLHSSCRKPGGEAACLALLDVNVVDGAQQRLALVALQDAATEHLRQGCMTSSKAACWALVDRNDDRKGEWLRQLCAINDGGACLVEVETAKSPDPKRKRHAITLLISECDAGNGDSCGLLASVIRRDALAAQIACKAGNSWACDVQKAAAAELATNRHTKACEALDLGACAQLDRAGTLTAKLARSVCERTTGRASADICLTAARLNDWSNDVLQEACKRGNREACERSAAQDAAWKCSQGDVAACRTAVRAGADRGRLSKGLAELCGSYFIAADCLALAEVQSSAERAALARQAAGCGSHRAGCFDGIRVKTLGDARFACDLGAAVGCEKAWALISSNRTEDDFESVAFRGCSVGSAALCEAIAGDAPSAYARGRWLAAACDLKSASACRAMAEIHCSGVGKDKDLQMCSDYEQKACLLGDRAACEAVKALSK